MSEVLSPDQVFIRKLTDIILANLENENFGVSDLVKESGMTLYRLSRNLRSIAGKPVNQFIREVKLQKAFDILQNKEFTVSEVAYMTGFSSPAYFNKCFREFYGYSPGKAKNGDSNNRPAGLTESSGRKTLWKTFIFSWYGILFLGILTIGSGIFIFTEFNNHGGSDDLFSPEGRISIAVLPFRNMTNDTLWNVWQDGIQTCLITSLSNSEELKVRQIETIGGLLRSKGHTNYASITPSVASSISQDLDAKVFVYGSINKAGLTIRVNAQLINSKTEEALKSFHIDGPSGNIMIMVDSLSLMIKNSLIISGLGKVGLPEYHEKYLKTLNSPEAYRYFIYGQNAFYNNDFSTAVARFKHALEIDTNLIGAMGKISISYYNDYNFEEAKEWGLRFYRKQDMMNMQERIWSDFIYALLFKTPNERIKCMAQMEEIDDQNPLTYFNKGDGYLEMTQYDRAIPEFEKALKIFRSRGTKPFWAAFYYELGQAYHKAGKYKGETRLYRKAHKDFPDDPGLLDQYAWLALIKGDTDKADKFIKEFTSMWKERSWSDARIASNIANIYMMAKMPDKAEEYLRQALSYEPENPSRINALAHILIDYERNIDEGMVLVEKVLQTNPDNFSSLGIKGWGLYKQGRYSEAFDVLQKSWDLRMERSIYNHTAFTYLEKAAIKVEEIR